MPSRPPIHAQRLAGHLPTSKPRQSSEKVVIRRDPALSSEVKTAAEPVSLVDISVELQEPVTLATSNATRVTQGDECELQKKKEALR